MPAVPIFGEERAFRLPRPSLIRRQLLPHRQHAPAEEVTRLAPVIARYGMETRGPIMVQGGGKRNEAWVLETTRGKLLLKRYKTTLTRGQIMHEHSILEHLHASGFPTARLVRDRAEETLVETEGRYYVLFDYLHGYAHYDEFFYYPRQEHWLQRAVGRTLGALHNALEGFVPRGENPNGFSALTGQRARDLAWYLERLAQAQRNAPQLQPGDPLRALLNEKGGWIGEQLQAVNESIEAVDPARGVIHGDFGPNNMLFKPGAPLVVLDFELARIDWLMVDVVAALSTSCSDDGGRADLARVLQGYLEERPIAPEALRLLPRVWQFQSLRRAIICCEQYTDTRRSALRVEAERRVERAEWVNAHHEDLASLAELAENQSLAHPNAAPIQG